MRRRSFLKSAAALPAGLQAIALGQATTSGRPSAESAVDGIHPVGPGQDRLGETHPLGFSTILFKVLTRDAGGGLFVIEHKGLGHGGPPVHIHPHQDEWFYVMEGQVLFHPEERKRFRRMLYLGLTDAFRVLHGEPHRFSWWDYRAGAWQRDQGLRIDHLLLSPQAADRLTGSGIDKTPRGWEKCSDHTPVWCELA